MNNDLYTSVPESAIKRQIADETAFSGIEWLVQIGDLNRASDGSIVLDIKVRDATVLTPRQGRTFRRLPK